MSIEFTTSDEDGYLLFSVTGSPESGEEMVSYVRTVREISQSTDTARVLVDETHARIPFDRYKDLIVSAVVSGIENRKPGLKVALLCAPGSIEVYKYFEPYFENSTLDLVAFESREEALEWLFTADGSHPASS